jgi:cellobiose-specific phosphotransferase system component IIA
VVVAVLLEIGLVEALTELMQAIQQVEQQDLQVVQEVLQEALAHIQEAGLQRQVLDGLTLDHQATQAVLEED